MIKQNFCKSFCFGTFFCAILLLSCGLSQISCQTNKNNTGTISITTWNTQEFFDSTNDGCEYDEFKKSQDWNRSSYLTRLNRLCDTLVALDSDIYVLEEIENAGILQDIFNQLAGGSWNLNSLWQYSAFTKEENSAIGCAILSRFPLYDTKIHTYFVKTEGSTQPSQRPILETRINLDGKSIYIFANHWKSKSEGQEKTEIWRDWAECIIGKRLNRISAATNGFENTGIVLCGDFNRDIQDFNLTGSRNVGFRFADFGHTGKIETKNGWLQENGEVKDGNGSYYYKKSWERIDHIFTSGIIKVQNSECKARSPWATEEGIPIGYKIYTGGGYSDHLPLSAVLLL